MIYPLVWILAVAWFVISIIRSQSSSRQKKKQTDGGPTEEKTTGPAGKTRKSPSPAEPLSARDGSRSEASGPSRGSLSGSAATGSGSLPVTEAYRQQGYGSLQSKSQEGKDPCHDDPRRIPVGSMQSGLPEGTDPCHDDARPVKQENAAPAGAQENGGGLNLSWTGDEIVKGFVYGEILRRKTG